MGADQETYDAVVEADGITRGCGILPTYSCTPYISENIPIKGETCAWAETAPVSTRTASRSPVQPGVFETALFSALLGITPNFGMHLDENRKGSHLIDVRCEMGGISDWGALGFFTGEKVGLGIPVFNHLRRPTVEEAKQLATCINVPGSTTLFHIPGVTPEAPTLEAAFGKNTPRETFVYDERPNRPPTPSSTTTPRAGWIWFSSAVPTRPSTRSRRSAAFLRAGGWQEGRPFGYASHATRAAACRAGYGRIIEESGGELFADGCLGMYYLYYPLKRPAMSRVATNAGKQAFPVRRTFGSNVFFGDEKRCIDIAVQGGT